MKLLHIQDEKESIVLPSAEKYTVKTAKYDIQKQWNNLQELVEEICKEEFDGIIISATLGSSSNMLGLEFCIRLRLSFSIIKEKAFTTLFIYLVNTVEEAYKNQIEFHEQPTASILLTKGAYVFDNSTSFEIIANNSGNYHQLNSDNFQSAFLNTIKINQPSELGNHSLANLMGVIELADITGHHEVLNSNANILKHSSDLYIKYKTDFTKARHINHKKIVIQSKGKKVLLVDDKEDHGWSDVLKEIFEKDVLEFIPSGADFIKRSRQKIFEKEWDLILLDLRLSDEEDIKESANKPGSAYSGATLLKEIKEKNRGNQVILFTASNKIWNFKELSDDPYYADGYFIKESPDMNLDESFSFKNFKNFETQVQDCFQRGFLKLFFDKSKKIKSGIKKAIWNNSFSAPDQLEINEFEFLAISKLNVAAEIIEKITSKNRSQKLRLAFLQLYQILEDYSHLAVIYRQASTVRSASKVFKKDKSTIDVFGPNATIAGNIMCNITFKTGRYSYQSSISSDTIVSVTFKVNTFNPRVNAKSQISETALFKILNIFKERHGYSEKKCDQIIELTYLRSNLCGHETGNIDRRKRDIIDSDIINLVSIIESIIPI